MSLVKKNTQRRAYDPWRDFFDIEDFSPLRLSWPSASSLPAVNVSEDNNSYHVDVVAPGYQKEDFKLHIEDDLLTISAESKSDSSDEDKKRQYSRREYSYSSFTRSFQLPENVQDDGISAQYVDGVLKIEIPKSEKQTKATKEIKIG